MTTQSCSDASRTAADPGTPFSTLRTLLEHRPDEVLANPAWALAEAAVPNLWNSLTSREWSAIIQSRVVAGDSLLQMREMMAVERKKFSMLPSLSIEVEVCLRADAPRELLADIAARWRPEAVNGVAVEIAHHRLALQDGSVEGWRAMVAAVFAWISSVSRSNATKGWPLVARMVGDGSLDARAPVLEFLPTCVPDFASRPVAREAARSDHVLISLVAYVRMARINSRYIDRGIMLTRAMLRRWEGRGELGPMPPRCAAAPIGGNRIIDPWEKERESLLRGIRGSVGREQDFPAGPHSLRSLDALAVAPWVRWAYLSSTCCGASELAAAANSPRWVERLAAASNPSLSASLRQELRRDCNLLVRGAAGTDWSIR